MKIKNWRSTIGGAFSALGTSLMAIGLLPPKNSGNIEILWWTAFAGFICLGLGQFFGHLFAADAKALKQVQAQMLQVPGAIEAGDTRFLRKAMTQPEAEAVPKKE